MSPENIIKAQVDAYNSRDLERFVNCHHPEIELFNYPEHIPFAKGRDRVAEIYKAVFKDSPLLNTKILNRIVMGDKVIDHEKITGRMSVNDFELIAVYEVKDGLIWKARFIR